MTEFEFFRLLDLDAAASQGVILRDYAHLVLLFFRRQPQESHGVPAFAAFIYELSADGCRSPSFTENWLPFWAGGVRRGTVFFVGSVTVLFFGKPDTTA